MRTVDKDTLFRFIDHGCTYRITSVVFVLHRSIFFHSVFGTFCLLFTTKQVLIFGKFTLDKLMQKETQLGHISWIFNIISCKKIIY